MAGHLRSCPFAVVSLARVSDFGPLGNLPLVVILSVLVERGLAEKYQSIYGLRSDRHDMV